MIARWPEKIQCRIKSKATVDSAEMNSYAKCPKSKKKMNGVEFKN
jgi:hypothetical protein